MFLGMPYVIMAMSLAVIAQPVNDDTGNEEDSAPPAEDCQEKAKDLKNGFEALEFFLRDKEDFKNHCPYLEWEQPALEIYKEEPKSYLPAECKAEKI
jgi:hypothetical protein